MVYVYTYYLVTLTTPLECKKIDKIDTKLFIIKNVLVGFRRIILLLIISKYEIGLCVCCNNLHAVCTCVYIVLNSKYCKI